MSRPSTDVAAINDRLEAVSTFIEDWALRERVRHALKSVPDMSRALSRLKLKRGGPRDLGALRDGLDVAAEVNALLREVPALPQGLGEICRALGAVPLELVGALKAALGEKLPFFAREGGFIAAGYDAALDELRQLTTDTKVVLAKLQAAYAERTGVKSLKVQYNQVFGYFVEVSPGAAPTLQAEPHTALFRHKQTLANAVRFTTDELSDLENRILNATSEALARETELFDKLAAAILDAEIAIGGAAAALADLDCTAALAELAHGENYVRPKVDNSRCFIVEGARHPAVEQALAREGGAFIGNDCKLDGSGANAPALLVVTGPNMAGNPPICAKTRSSRSLRRWDRMFRRKRRISAWLTGSSPASAQPTISREAAPPLWSK